MMDIESFREFHTRMATLRPKLFQLIAPDAPATEQSLRDVEAAVGATLPASYRQFLLEFGGGSFGFTNVCSADPSSEFYLPHKQEEARSYLPGGFLTVSDDHSGGLYLLKVEGGAAGESLFYWNDDGGLIPTRFSNVLEFVAKYGYSAA